jgi:serine/threonine-protein kinase
MNDRPDGSDEQASAEDERLFPLLDRYVESKQRGDPEDCSDFSVANPEMLSWIDCLDSLDLLAPPRSMDLPGDAPGVQPDAEIEGQDNGDSQSATRFPTDFGKYELFEEIGRGGMGVVFRARQKDLDRTVALKMILSSRLASPSDVQRFQGEARAAGRLRHPNIVAIHEVGEINGQHYFAMEYIEGRNLARALREDPFDAEQAAECIIAVARAVDYLHGHRIVHRDLKPSNIQLDDAGKPYVTDFGLAKVFEIGSEQTQSGAIIGTPSYMSPEQAAGKASQVSPQSDVYSLGAILYEMLTGRPPFQRLNPLDTLVDVLEGEPTLPCSIDPEIPRELELICLHCLEKDPRKRYPTAAALADDLERYLRREAIEARPSGIVQRLIRWGRRDPALVSRLGALLAASSIVQGSYWIYGQDWNAARHGEIMSLFGIWMVVSFLFQNLLRQERFAEITRFAWAAADTLLLTMLLLLSDSPLGGLLVGYPLLVAASGLFFRVQLVCFTTFSILVAYAVLITIRTAEADPPLYSLIFAAGIALLGFIIAYQVHRVRALSQYYESRRIP